MLTEFQPGLLYLETFEMIWLIYYLNRASVPRMHVRPYLEDKEHGIFATRAPARPNLIGLTAVRLRGIDNHRLLISSSICWMELRCSASNPTFLPSIVFKSRERDGIRTKMRDA